MKKLRYYTSQALSKLRDDVPLHLDWYYAPTSELPEWTAPPGGVKTSALIAPELAGKLILGGHQKDIDNALLVSKELAHLTPYQASVERLWTYLCHRECPQYVASRWLHTRPADGKEAIRKVRNHFFAGGNRALIRDNGLSRLWWLGAIAKQIESGNPRHFLTILLHRQDVRSALIERASLSMNRDVLRCIYWVMAEYWKTEPDLFQRKIFRRWMVSLNRRGGVVLLDALPEETLLELLRDEANRALRGAGEGG